MTATKTKITARVLLIVGIATVLLLQYRRQQTAETETNALREQITTLTADNEALSNRLLSLRPGPALIGEPDELLKLRGEIAGLKSQLAHSQNSSASISTEGRTTDPAAEQIQLQRRRMVDAKTLVAAVWFGYSERHHNEFPTNWDQVAPYFADWERRQLNAGDVMPDADADFARVTNEYELTFQSSITNLYGLTNFSDIIVVRPKQAWQNPDGSWVKVYGFADGHSLLLREPPEGFDTWEAQRLPPH